MKVKNNSSRPYFIGGVLLVPDGVETVSDEWATAIADLPDLEVVEKKSSVGRPPKVVEPSAPVVISESTKAE